MRFSLLVLICISTFANAQQPTSLKVAERYAFMGFTEKAGPSLDSVLEEQLNANDTDAWCSAVGTIGKAYSRKHPEKAIAHLQKYIPLAEALFGHQHLVVAELHARMGDVYRKAQVGDFIQAAEHFDRAIALYEAHGISSRFLGFVYHFAGNCHTRNGSYEKAARYLQQSAEIRTKEGDSLYVAQVCNDLGILYNNLGSYIRAELLYSKGVRFIDVHSKGRKQALLQATLHLNKADNSLNLDSKIAIDSLLRPVLKVFSKYNDVSGMSATNRSIGQWLLQTDRSAEALPYLQKGLDLAKSKFGTHHREVGKAHVALAKAYRKMGIVDSSQSHLQGALKSLIPTFHPVDKNNLPTRELLYAEPWLLIALQEKADAYMADTSRNTASLKNALACFDAAMVTMELIRNQYSYPADRERLFSSFHSIIEGGIFTSLELAKRTKSDAYNKIAFGYLSKSKAYSLMEWFSGYEAQSVLLIPDSIVSQERNLLSKMLGLKSTAQSKELANTKQEFERLSEVLSVKYPAYHDIKYGSHAFSMEEIRDHLLDNNEVLIEYVLSEKRLACFLVSKEHFNVWSIDLSPSFHQSVSSFITDLRSPDLNGSVRQLAEEMDREGYILYQKLMDIPLSYMDSLGLGNYNIIIIPDGNLHYLPFESLVTDRMKTYAGFNQMQFLVKSRNIRYAYSATTLHHQKTMKPAQTKLHDIVAFAPNEALISANTELKAISELLTGQFYFGEGASKGKFLEQSGKAKIVHVAAHGHLIDDNPMHSSLSFSQSVKDTGSNDKELFAFELFNLNIAADLVVLGACNTGRGSLIDGEGVMSLERGFSYAQCKSTVMTLWEVNDRSTANVLTDFYKNLKAGNRKHEALNKAQKNYLANAGGIKAHPYFWAGIVFHGDDTSLDLEKSPSIWLLLLLAMPFGTFALWHMFKKRN